MFHSHQQLPTLLVAFLLLILGAVGCAKQSSPEGGPYDMTPPRVVRCTPEMGSTNVTSHRVRITFDEYIQLERGEDKIIYSPPQRIPPKALVNQKQLVITYQDSLIANTTYTINFNRAIKDYNEGNYIEQYVYAFSTGDYLDTMQVAGLVLDAYTLQPVPRILAGIYATPLPADTLDRPMTRMTYTDDQGHFTLQNVRDGAYYAIALVDMDRSYSYNAPNESFAITPDSFRTEVVHGSAFIPAKETKVDSLRNAPDSLQSAVDSLGASADSLLTKEAAPTTATDSTATSADSVSPYVYMPNDLVLLLTRPKTNIIRLERLTRRDSMSLMATFTEPLDTLPQLTILSPSYLTSTTSYYPDLSTDRKSLVYWLSPHDSLARDSVVVAFAYPTTDSIGSPINKLDTMTLQAPRVHAAKAKASPKKQPKIAAPQTATDSLTLTSDSTALADPKNDLKAITILSLDNINKETTRDSLWISYDMPILGIDTTLVQLAKLVDSVPQPISCQLRPDSIRRCRWLVDFAKEPGTTYRLMVDTAAITGLYGGVSAPAQKDLKIASETELGSLSVTLTGHPTDSPLYVYLLSSKEEILATAQPDSAGIVTFTELAPGAYFLKLYVDLNSNGTWDGGVYPATPPEPVRYLPQTVNVQARFATEQTWAYDGTPLAEQRPKELEGDKQAEGDGNRAKPETQKRDLNVEYAQRMRERYGKRWNPTDRERKIMGLPSRAEEREARARGENVEIGAPPKEQEKGQDNKQSKPQTQPLGTGSGSPLRTNPTQTNPSTTRQSAGQLQNRSQKVSR
ncbi:Ig-like domain-containing protein [Porphyromonas asaccharolytica]|uniref:Ig-like domain-containing protein n=1 Tax=Porphyromonas asaccharolytica TaxID=28123 RepID=UPI00248DB42C|nr:Ig-like domain-containing protein [Porphyromonas asaccharolytica]